MGIAPFMHKIKKAPYLTTQKRTFYCHLKVPYYQKKYLQCKQHGGGKDFLMNFFPAYLYDNNYILSASFLMK